MAEPPGQEVGDIDEADAQRAFAAGYDEVLESIGRFNVAMVGDTGVGRTRSAPRASR